MFFKKRPLPASQLPKGCPSHLHTQCKACGYYNPPQAVKGRYTCLKCHQGTYYVDSLIAKASEKEILKQHEKEREARRKDERIRREAETRAAERAAAATAIRKQHVAQQLQQERRETVAASPTAPLERRPAQRKRAPSAAKAPWTPSQTDPPRYAPQRMFVPATYPPNGPPARPLPPLPASSSVWL